MKIFAECKKIMAERKTRNYSKIDCESPSQETSLNAENLFATFHCVSKNFSPLLLLLLVIPGCLLTEKSTFKSDFRVFWVGKIKATQIEFAKILSHAFSLELNSFSRISLFLSTMWVKLHLILFTVIY